MLAPGVTLYLGRSEEILPRIADQVGALVGDPPYGYDIEARSSDPRSRDGTKRGEAAGLLNAAGRAWEAAPVDNPVRVAGDEQPFDPGFMFSLGIQVFVVWGGNHFAGRLPDARCWLCWDKRDGARSDDQADCEFAWTNLDRPARLFSHKWRGLIKASERDQRRVHPTQKPIALMEWCLDMVPAGLVICDPYMGSGTTGVACIRQQRPFIGIDCDAAYFDVACKRLESELKKAKASALTEGEGFAGDDLVAPTRSQFSTGRIHKKRKLEGSNVLDLARERVAEIFKLFDTVAVSFSGGKDSTVVLQLALEEAQRRKQRLPVFHFDEEAIPYETEEYVRRCAAMPLVDLDWYCLPIQHRNACTRRDPYWFPWAPEDQALWVRPLPPEAITWDKVEGFPAERARRPSMPDSMGLLFPALKFGRVAMLMGIRADESLTRTRAILMTTPDSRSYIRAWNEGTSQGNLFKCYPIYDWSTADVWTAPAKLGWDYNRAYDAMEMAGISHIEQRCAPPYGEEPLRGLWMYSVCFPAIWDKMSRRVPGAATAARYSQTELYSYGSKPQKPAGMMWPAFLRQWLMKHPPEYRTQIAGRVKMWIDNHFKKTTEPIAPRAPHPQTGVSWEYLLMIAVRGDYKDRKQPPVPPDMTSARKRYDADVAGAVRGEIAGA